MLSVLFICGLSLVSSDNVNFLFFGDWGYAGVNQTLVASQMGAWSTTNDVDFVVALGDNFYKEGVMNDTDPQWINTYSSVFASPALQIPWYAILGNHDYIRNAQAQIDYYKNKRDNRWIMPDHVYNVIYPLGDSYPGAPTTATLEIVFIDTSILVPSLFGENITPRQTQDALTKIESLLAASTATWLIVAGHYTIYSSAEHGNTNELIASIVPLLKKYQVQAYLNGHDHVLQDVLMDGVHYITSGHGAMTDNYPTNENNSPITDNREQLLYFSLSFGFSSATVTSNSATFRFHNGAKSGQVDFTVVLSNPRIIETTTDTNNKKLSARERRRHTLRAVLMLIVGLLIGALAGMLAPTSWRVALIKRLCGGQLKFCDRKASGDSLNTMVPVTEPTNVDKSSNGSSINESETDTSHRAWRLIANGLAGLVGGSSNNTSGSITTGYGRVDSSDHGGSSIRHAECSELEGLELGTK